MGWPYKTLNPATRLLLPSNLVNPKPPCWRLCSRFWGKFQVFCSVFCVYEMVFSVWCAMKLVEQEFYFQSRAPLPILHFHLILGLLVQEMRSYVTWFVYDLVLLDACICFWGSFHFSFWIRWTETGVVYEDWILLGFFVFVILLCNWHLFQLSLILFSSMETSAIRIIRSVSPLQLHH